MSDQPEFKIDTGRCASCAVRHQAVCGVLSDKEILRLNQMSRRRIVGPGQIVLNEADQTEFFANIVSGVVKLAKTLPDGRQQIVGLLFAPDFLGRAYCDDNPYYAEAATEVELCCFPRDSFEALLSECPDLEHRLFEQTLDELDSAREWMLLLGRKSAQEKIASFLYLLAKRAQMTGCAHSPSAPVPVFELPLTRADIADYLGVTIETVSRQITRLKTIGLINLIDTHHIAIPDLDALGAMSGQEMAGSR